jgi:hypothetical protein
MTAHKCTELTLRILISLSHENRHFCEAILQQELAMPFVVRAIVKSHRQRISSFGSKANPGSETDKEAQPLDRLCLALGLLTNLVQSTDVAKEQCREIRELPFTTLASVIDVEVRSSRGLFGQAGLHT